MIARTDAWQAERERLATAVYVTDAASDITARSAGLRSVSADQMAKLATAAIDAERDGVPLVLALPSGGRDLLEYLEGAAPRVELLAMRFPDHAKNLGELLRFGGDLDELQRDVLAEWLAGTSGGRPNVYSAKMQDTGARRTSSRPPWPSPLSDAVRIGVLGEFLDVVEEQSEADPAALAFDFLVRLGIAVGPVPHFRVESCRHHANLFVAICGQTSTGRKGTSAAYATTVFHDADETFRGRCLGGLSSGEGVIWAVRDPMPTGKRDDAGEPVMDAGIDDKRLLLFESELAKVFRAASRRDSTLMPVLRQAWDGGRLQVMTKAAYKASDVHIGLVSHVVPGELVALLSDGDVDGGTANRLLFVCSRQSRELPFGGQVHPGDLERVAHRVRDVIARAQMAGEVVFDRAARERWPAVYHDLLNDTRGSGLSAKLLGRAVPQTRRLAMLLAIADGEVCIGMRHLAGALELWRYARESALHLFGSSTGNRTADRILAELRAAPDGMRKTEIHALFLRHLPAGEIDDALDLLRETGSATCETVRTGGRPAEVWRAK